MERMNIWKHTDKFRNTIEAKLTSSSSSKYIRISFDHAVYRKLFGDKIELNAQDFREPYFSAGWDSALKQHVGVARTIYSGRKVLYPILTYPYLGHSRKSMFCKLGQDNYKLKPLVHIEMLRIFVTVEECI